MLKRSRGAIGKKRFGGESMQQYSHSRTVIKILLELDVHVDHVYCIILTLVVSEVTVMDLLPHTYTPLPFTLG